MAQQDSTPKKAVSAPRFLAHYRRSGNITAACEAAGIDRGTYYDWMRDDPQFAAAVAIGSDDALDGLEEIGWERAKTSSDLLLIFFLKAGRPQKYREKSQVDLFVRMSPEQLVATIMEEEPKALGSGEEEG